MSVGWSIEEQEEVKLFYRINDLEMDEWPKNGNSHDFPDLLEEKEYDEERRRNDLISTSRSIGSLSLLKAKISGSKLGEEEGENENENDIQMTGSMASAKALIEEVKDPLGLNDSLYQMQVQRILLDPKYSTSSQSILLNSSHFDARLYLRLVHQFTSYEDLIRSINQLQASLNLRKDVLKMLVRQNFDRFVNAKNSIDSVYTDMRVKGMNSGDYGMQLTKSSINVALEKSHFVYHPLLKRRSREECIRKRLSIFQEYKSIFKLPAILHHHMRLGQFQQCVHEYRRGRELLQAEPATSELKTILEKVWELHVERGAGRVLREVLFEKLNNPNYSFQVQSKIIFYLQGLSEGTTGGPDSIILHFLNCKSNLILIHLNSIQNEAISRLNELNSEPVPENEWIFLLKDSLKIVKTNLYEKFNTKLSYPVVREWKIIHEAILQLCSSMKLIILPLTKFTATTANTNINVSVSNAVLSDTVKTIQDCLQSTVDSICKIKKTDNSVIGMYYSSLIIRQLGEMYALILDSNPHPIISTAFKNTFMYQIEVLLGRVWANAVVDSRNMGGIADWQMDSCNSNMDFSTALVRSFESYLSFMIKSTLSCRNIFQEVVNEYGAAPFDNLNNWIIKSINDFIIDGMYRYVRSITANDDGMEDSLGDDNNFIDTLSKQKQEASIGDFLILNSTCSSTTNTAGKFDLLKFNEPSRLLVVLSNVKYFQAVGLKNILNLFPENYSISTAKIEIALKTVEGAVTQMFLQGQVGRIIEPIESYWLIDQDIRFTDSNEAEAQTSSLHLSTPIYKSLLALSDVKCQISDVMGPNLHSNLYLLKELANSLISCLLNSLKIHVTQLTEPVELLQAWLDISFIKSRLNALITGEAGDLIDKMESVLLDQMKVYKITERQIKEKQDEFENDQTGPFSNVFSSFQ